MKLAIIDNMPAIVTTESHAGKTWLVNQADRTIKERPGRQQRQITTHHTTAFKEAPVTIHMESTNTTTDGARLLKVRSNGKVHTSLAALARAHQTYAFGKPERVISDAHLFNQLTQKRIKANTFAYTERVLPMRKLQTVVTIAPKVNGTVLDAIGDLFTAILLFKGHGYRQIKQDLAIARHNGDSGVTYNVNTTITVGEYKFTVAKIRVKKTFDDGLFFCSKSCHPVKQLVTNIRMAQNYNIANIE